MIALSYLGNSFNNIDSSWQEFLINNYSHKLCQIDQELTKISANNTIFPYAHNVLRALKLPIRKCNVVIIGQDPYHGENEANGLAFAVNKGVKTPPSLKNIFKELCAEYNPILINLDHFLLENWFNQGVLLLNTSLTVIKDQPNSLSKIGWHEVTDGIINHISEVNNHCVFILWGNYAREKKNLIDTKKHLILESAHPSPFSANRGFFGCNHFKLTNEYLVAHNKPHIEWI